MKRIFYPSFTLSNKLAFLFLAFLLTCAVVTKAQTYIITFPFPDPTDNSAGGPLDKNDANGGIETGVRFRVTQPGFITGIRFLKGTLNTGVHIGHLWSNDGTTKLAEATFSETAGGWQEVAVNVHITAGTHYVASVFNDVGDYSVEDISTTQTWQDHGGPPDYGTDPIKPLAYSSDPAHNGVFIYTNSANGAFPSQDGGANNYWIDIRFQPDFALPVTLSDLKTTVANSDVAISWKTTSESNNRGFEIQRSNNGADWYAVSFINGAGESTVIKNYSYTDKGLAPGLYYYRLKQTDNDGKFKNSSIATAVVSGKGRILLFQNAPNPFRGSATIRFDLPNSQKVRLSIIDILGREVKVLTDKLSEAGSHIIPVDGTGLSRQLYYIRLQTESGTLTKNMLVE